MWAIPCLLWGAGVSTRPVTQERKLAYRNYFSCPLRHWGRNLYEAYHLLLRDEALELALFCPKAKLDKAIQSQAKPVKPDKAR